MLSMCSVLAAGELETIKKGIIYLTPIDAIQIAADYSDVSHEYYSSVSSSAKGIVSLSFGNARPRLRLNVSQLDAARINASTAHKCCCNFG